MNLADLLTITRPIVCFDTETTGLHPDIDHVVSMTTSRLPVTGETETVTRMFNPGVPIPADATAIHGISDSDVADADTFEDHAERISTEFKGVDVLGYNVRFDIRMLIAEFARLGKPSPFGDDTCILDGHRLWSVISPRGLGECGRTFGATVRGGELHTSDYDTNLSMDVFVRMLNTARFKSWPSRKAHIGGKMSTFPITPKGLHDLLFPKPDDYADEDGKFRTRGDSIFCAFGKHSGTVLQSVPSSYLNWMIRGEFGESTLGIVRSEIDRREDRG